MVHNLWMPNIFIICFIIESLKIQAIEPNTKVWKQDKIERYTLLK